MTNQLPVFKQKNPRIVLFTLFLALLLFTTFIHAQSNGKTFDTDSVIFDKAPILTWKSDHTINGKASYNGFLLVKAKLNGVYDINGGMQRQETFNVGAIDVWGNDDDPRLWMDLHQTQIRLWSERQTKHGSFIGYLETDAWAGNSGMRLRYAWFDYRFLRIGQDLSTFGDKLVWPNIMDWDGPPSGVWRRQPQIKLYWENPSKWYFAVAGEISEDHITFINAIDSNLTNGYSNLPNITAAIKKSWKENTYLRLAGIYRILHFKDSEARKQTSGYGLALSGKLQTHPTKQNLIQFQLAGGKGISTYLGSFGSMDYDAISTSTGNVDAVNVYGAWISYEYWFNEKWHSNMCWGYTDFESPSIAYWPLQLEPNLNLYNTDISLQYYYVLTNIMFDPIPGLTFGIEYNYGRKTEKFQGNLDSPTASLSTNKHGRSANRISFGVFFSF